MIQVHLDAAGQPSSATYAQHNEGQRCPWPQVERHPGSTHPDVFVARESHASYFHAGGLYEYTTDDADGLGDVVTPAVTEVTGSVPWLRWPGHWGGTDWGEGSPVGPKHQAHQKWDDPEAWSQGDDIDTC